MARSGITNNLARLLGSTLGSIKKEFKYGSSSVKAVGATFKKLTTISTQAPVVRPSSVKALEPVRVQASAPSVAVLERPAPVVRPRHVERAVEQVVEEPRVEKKATSQVVALKNIEFDNKAQQIEAEVYFKDLQSPSRGLRMEALREIKKFPRHIVAGLLQQLLFIEQDNLQIIEILNALAGIGDESLISKKVFKDFTRAGDAGIRLAALRAISKYHDEESFSILTPFMKDKDAEVRRQVLNCLCWTFGERSLPFAVSALYDADAGVRKAASQITGALKEYQAVSGLISLLSDTEKDVQASAAASLKKITGEDFNFKVSGSKQAKDDAVEAWRFWWRENQSKFEHAA